jgi:hypothetical protein
LQQKSAFLWSDSLSLYAKEKVIKRSALKGKNPLENPLAFSSCWVEGTFPRQFLFPSIMGGCLKGFYVPDPLPLRGV